LMIHSQEHTADAQVDDLPEVPGNFVYRSHPRRPSDFVSTRAPRFRPCHRTLPEQDRGQCAVIRHASRKP
jgi:hypothetical protein